MGREEAPVLLSGCHLQGCSRPVPPPSFPLPRAAARSQPQTLNLAPKSDTLSAEGFFPAFLCDGEG